ncbi:MAG TPA: hypothetical protein VNF00_02430 [Candidatus Acidoferrales bacterium]|nr:hypothetical protein [Candidatus Acidoferrales bacterium]
MLQPAEIGHDSEFSDSSRALKVLDLANDLLRRADEADFLLDNLFIR